MNVSITTQHCIRSSPAANGAQLLTNFRAYKLSNGIKSPHVLDELLNLLGLCRHWSLKGVAPRGNEGAVLVRSTPSPSLLLCPLLPCIKRDGGRQQVQPKNSQPCSLLLSSLFLLRLSHPVSLANMNVISFDSLLRTCSCTCSTRTCPCREAGY